MKTAVVSVLLFTVLLVAMTEANFYGKRGENGVSLKQIIQDMRLQQARVGMSAEEVLDQIEMLIQRWKSAREAAPRGADSSNMAH